MVIYSIKDLEKLSGVKAHTLRIWEKRYNIVQPKRTATNIRYYLDDDLKNILNIALLNRNGIKISKIAMMEPSDIAKKVAEITEVDESFEGQLDSLTISLIELNEDKFIKLINKNIEQQGFINTMLDVVYPLLDKLAVMWLSGSIKSIHEKFVSRLIKRKCLVEIDKLETTRKETFMIFLPENESNELSLLFLHYLIRKNGFQVINAGVSVQAHELLEVKQLRDVDYIYTIINDAPSDQELNNYLRLLQQTFNNTQFILSGLKILSTQIDADLLHRITTVRSSEETISYLNQL